MDPNKLKELLPEDVSLEELLPFLRPQTKADLVKLEVYDKACVHQVKHCLSCGSNFEGDQYYYPGYEGDFIKTELRWCPYCFKDHIVEYFKDCWNFELTK